MSVLLHSREPRLARVAAIFQLGLIGVLLIARIAASFVDGTLLIPG